MVKRLKFYPLESRKMKTSINVDIREGDKKEIKGDKEGARHLRFRKQRLKLLSHRKLSFFFKFCTFKSTVLSIG